ncbi:hypothetical protein M408DRAFT_331460 [Serendipita vermifera MAFF 305830]|uniref:Uncharacterized protein n=1 Tax=Serendipita vermifera MAFF 305830 TaxID=933852 RepID=A0A0C2WEW9_SERVB|nr:hypothetical protein M408DRAFT_331460 [Serendipita vermifera MAFF 305830]
MISLPGRLRNLPQARRPPAAFGSIEAFTETEQANDPAKAQKFTAAVLDQTTITGT